MEKQTIPIDLEKMSKEDLIILLKQLHSNDDEKPYHPDSMMAMALASPKEARRIAWRTVHPFAKFMMFVVVCIFVSIFIFLMTL